MDHNLKLYNTRTSKVKPNQITEGLRMRPRRRYASIKRIAVQRGGTYRFRFYGAEKCCLPYWQRQTPYVVHSQLERNETAVR